MSRFVRATRLLFVLLALLARSAAAATIAISLANRADPIEIEGSAELNADAETAWRVLTDYERYVDFIPGPAGEPCRCAQRRDRHRRGAASRDQSSARLSLKA